MRILAIHNRYRIRGGEEECLAAEVDLLRQYGHEVTLYEDSNDRLNELSTLTKVTKAIWSQQAYQAVREILRSQTYQVVHVHNFLSLISPSVYYAARDEGVPVVQTLHNYRLLCPNALFFRDGRVCEDCLGKFLPLPGVIHACYRQDRAVTAMVSTMLAVHRAIGTWQQMVDRYITLTEFTRAKFIAGGLPADKLMVKPNFVNPDPGIGAGDGGYMLYVGRLSVEKGLDVLLSAWEKLGDRIPLKIVGDGPLATDVVAVTQTNPQIEWLGRLPMAQVYDLMGAATGLIISSKWYETFGRVAVEAFAKGTPVIAANLGAIAEIVDAGRTGLHFRVGDSDDLAAKVELLLSDQLKLQQMREQARTEYVQKYTADRNYQELIAIYNSLATAPSDVQSASPSA
ncbi:glycosyl transferase group 1 [Thalassoporum mexicanum PCC 7367]|uniref:glycosyltransferase n=1 Tax=Thalassoporum mexicanum TaxID=3457544 RepID=UPI00029F9D15|nr:glycosyltransferase [Pseudanabaena sp. PCC 7367]AFY71623.1 glycosyl transferase group 1 [Pseudanabaena sp. PCC 7367]